MNLYRVTVERQVLEVAEVEVRAASAKQARAVVNSDLRGDRLLSLSFAHSAVVTQPHAVHSTEVA
jgi:hypothetical protein